MHDQSAPTPDAPSNPRRAFLVRVIQGVHATIGATLAFVLGSAVLAPSLSRRERLWLSAGDSLSTNEPLLRRRAAELRRVFDEARELLAGTHSEFIELRPLVLPARGQTRRAAEFSVTLAVCSALGELAEIVASDASVLEPCVRLTGSCAVVYFSSPSHDGGGWSG